MPLLPYTSLPLHVSTLLQTPTLTHLYPCVSPPSYKPQPLRISTLACLHPLTNPNPYASLPLRVSTLLQTPTLTHLYPCMSLPSYKPQPLHISTLACLYPLTNPNPYTSLGRSWKNHGYTWKGHPE